jgi:hypothetical protein
MCQDLNVNTILAPLVIPGNSTVPSKHVLLILV